MSDVAVYMQRGKSPKYSEERKVPVISQKCVQWSGFSVEKAKLIVPESLKSYTSERLLQKSDLLVTSTGTGMLGRSDI